MNQALKYNIYQQHCPARLFFEKIADFSPTFTFLKRYSYIEGQKIPHSPFSAP